MITYIESVHEETITDSNKTIGLIYNYNEDRTFKDSCVYVYTQKSYIFFETVIDMFDYLYYGDKTKVNRAYLPEPEFDEYLESEIKGKFSDYLTWQTGE